MKVTAVIVSGGSGRRMGADINKVLLPVNGYEAIYYTIKAFEETEEVDEIVLVTKESEKEIFLRLADKYGFSKVKEIVTGGDTRQKSVKQGICAASGDIVCIHDGARALVTHKIIQRAIADCIEYGAAAAGVICKDTLKSVRDGFITGTIDRETTYQIQTPQVFFKDELLQAHEIAENANICATDDCMLMENIGKEIRISKSSYDNLKLTTPDDIEIAGKILKKREKSS